SGIRERKLNVGEGVSLAATAFSLSAEDAARLLGPISISIPSVRSKGRITRINAASPLVHEHRHWRSPLLGVVQVHPRLDVPTLAETCFLLRLGEFLARVISPATLPKKGIPDRNFLFAGAPAMREAPFEDFLI